MLTRLLLFFTVCTALLPQAFSSSAGVGVDTVDLATSNPKAVHRYVVESNGSACIIFQAALAVIAQRVNFPKVPMNITKITVNGSCSKTSSVIHFTIHTDDDDEDPSFSDALFSLSLSFSLDDQEKSWAMTQAVFPLPGGPPLDFDIFGVSAPVGQSFACTVYGVNLKVPAFGTLFFSFSDLRIQALGIENSTLSPEVTQCSSDPAPSPVQRYSVRSNSGADCIIMQADIRLTRHSTGSSMFVANTTGVCGATQANMILTLVEPALKEVFGLNLYFDLKDEDSWYLSRVSFLLFNYTGGDGSTEYETNATFTPEVSAPLGQSYSCDNVQVMVDTPSGLLEFDLGHIRTQALDITKNRLSSEVLKCGDKPRHRVPRYAVRSENGSDCIILEADMKLQANSHVNVPWAHPGKNLRATEVVGECSTTQANILLTFAEDFALNFFFELKGDDSWFIASVISIESNATNGTNSTIIDANSTIYDGSLSPEVFAPLGHSYSCDDVELRVNSIFGLLVIDLTNFRAQALDITNNSFSSKVKPCHKKPLPIVTIAVGVGIALLLLGVLIGYLVVRARSHRAGYMAL
ncbi:uncharacterized protein LOC135808200 [Sycon ciliatum]|uniref:uncharacterized protein LOC135808200 n=1 Tax=Sycon ciliatum TaxID=27933 RepID=UPI0020AEB919|eukprot:scpid48947/ scgid9008/ 